MKKNKYSTISVMTKTQKAVKANSEKRGMTQSEYVDRAVTDFERNAKFKARRKADLNLEDMTYEEVLAFVATSLSALSKRNDVSRIISFIRKQEEEIPLISSFEAETWLLWMWAGPSCFLSSGDGCVGNFLSCRKAVKDPLEVPGVRCD